VSESESIQLLVNVLFALRLPALRLTYKSIGSLVLAPPHRIESPSLHPIPCPPSQNPLLNFVNPVRSLEPQRFSIE
jgi:hypothetical protein